jgi:hypothetical protein
MAKFVGLIWSLRGITFHCSCDGANVLLHPRYNTIKGFRIMGNTLGTKNKTKIFNPSTPSPKEKTPEPLSSLFIYFEISLCNIISHYPEQG